MTEQLNDHPGSITVYNDSTLGQPTTITVTINATSREQNPYVYLTLLNSFLTPPTITTISSSDKLLLVLQNLLDLLQHTDLRQCIHCLDNHLSLRTPKSKSANNTTSLLPIATPRVLRSNFQC